MSKKYHIASCGTRRICNARVRPCRVSGPAGMGQFHGTKEEVQAKIDEYFAENFTEEWNAAGGKMTIKSQRLIIKDWKEKIKQAEIQKVRDSIHTSASGNDYTIQAILDGKGNFSKQHIMQRINFVNKIHPGHVTEEEKVALLDKYYQEQKAKWTKPDPQIFDDGHFKWGINEDNVYVGEIVGEGDERYEPGTRKLHFEGDEYTKVPHILINGEIKIDPKYEKRARKNLGDIGYMYHIADSSPARIYYDEETDSFKSVQELIALRRGRGYGPAKYPELTELAVGRCKDESFADNKIGGKSQSELVEDHKKNRLKRYTKFFKDEDKAKQMLFKEIQAETNTIFQDVNAKSGQLFDISDKLVWGDNKLTLETQSFGARGISHEDITPEYVESSVIRLLNRYSEDEGENIVSQLKSLGVEIVNDHTGHSMG